MSTAGQLTRSALTTTDVGTPPAAAAATNVRLNLIEDAINTMQTRNAATVCAL
jgi:hypothetical protein